MQPRSDTDFWSGLLLYVTLGMFVLFLCTPAARLVSGQVVAVDGAGATDQLKLGLGRM